MRKLLVVLLLAFAASNAPAQLQNMYTIMDSTATTAWKKVSKSNNAKITYFEIANDATSGVAKLYVAFGDDTTYARRFGLAYGEVLTLDNIYVNHLYIRTSSGTIAYRLRYH